MVSDGALLPRELVAGLDGELLLGRVEAQLGLIKLLLVLKSQIHVALKLLRSNLRRPGVIRVLPASRSSQAAVAAFVQHSLALTLVLAFLGEIAGQK